MDELRGEAKSTAEMVQAEARGMELWDAELNRVYRLLLTKLPEPDRSERRTRIVKQRAENLRGYLATVARRPALPMI